MTSPGYSVSESTVLELAQHLDEDHPALLPRLMGRILEETHNAEPPVRDVTTFGRKLLGHLEGYRYDALGVQHLCSAAQIKKAYRKLALAYHPDKNPVAAELFSCLSRAYEVLGDKDERAKHDREYQIADRSASFARLTALALMLGSEPPEASAADDSTPTDKPKRRSSRLLQRAPNSARNRTQLFTQRARRSGEKGHPSIGRSSGRRADPGRADAPAAAAASGAASRPALERRNTAPTGQAWRAAEPPPDQAVAPEEANAVGTSESGYGGEGSEEEFTDGEEETTDEEEETTDEEEEKGEEAEEAEVATGAKEAEAGKGAEQPDRTTTGDKAMLERARRQREAAERERKERLAREASERERRERDAFLRAQESDEEPFTEVPALGQRHRGLKARYQEVMLTRSAIQVSDKPAADGAFDGAVRSAEANDGPGQQQQQQPGPWWSDVLNSFGLQGLVESGADEPSPPPTPAPDGLAPAAADFHEPSLPAGSAPAASAGPPAGAGNKRPGLGSRKFSASGAFGDLLSGQPIGGSSFGEESDATTASPTAGGAQPHPQQRQEGAHQPNPAQQASAGREIGTGGETAAAADIEVERRHAQEAELEKFRTRQGGGAGPDPPDEAEEEEDYADLVHRTELELMGGDAQSATGKKRASVGVLKTLKRLGTGKRKGSVFG